MSLEGLVKNLKDDDFKISEKYPDECQYLNKILAYPYENFNGIDDYKKLVDKLNKEIFFSKLKKMP